MQQGQSYYLSACSARLPPCIPIGFLTGLRAVASAVWPPWTRRPPRDRLLDAATELFYRDGVSIGVEALCRSAGVSKRSMYQLFDSKDEVLAAGLERRRPWYEAQLRSPDAESATPRERIQYVFRRAEENAAAPGYCGCPYLAVLVELKDSEHPALLARQLMLIFDGAGARIEHLDDGLLTATATTLLDAAGVK